MFGMIAFGVITFAGFAGDLIGRAMTKPIRDGIEDMRRFTEEQEEKDREFNEKMKKMQVEQKRELNEAYRRLNQRAKERRK